MIRLCNCRGTALCGLWQCSTFQSTPGEHARSTPCSARRCLRTASQGCNSRFISAIAPARKIRTSTFSVSSVHCRRMARSAFWQSPINSLSACVSSGAVCASQLSGRRPNWKCSSLGLPQHRLAEIPWIGPNNSRTSQRFAAAGSSVSPVATLDLRKKECNQPRPESNPQRIFEVVGSETECNQPRPESNPQH